MLYIVLKTTFPSKSSYLEGQHGQFCIPSDSLEEKQIGIHHRSSSGLALNTILKSCIASLSLKTCLANTYLGKPVPNCFWSFRFFLGWLGVEHVMSKLLV